jgi:hypothetical protein
MVSSSAAVQRELRLFPVRCLLLAFSFPRNLSVLLHGFRVPTELSLEVYSVPLVAVPGWFCARLRRARIGRGRWLVHFGVQGPRYLFVWG